MTVELKFPTLEEYIAEGEQRFAFMLKDLSKCNDKESKLLRTIFRQLLISQYQEMRGLFETIHISTPDIKLLDEKLSSNSVL